MGVTEEAAEPSTRVPINRAAIAAARAPIPDLHTVLDRDRRSGIERIIELGRWIVLIFAGISVNLSGSVAPGDRGVVNLLLGSWAAFNLVVTAAVMSGYLPSRNIQYAMLGLDITVGSTIVYLTGGLHSDLGMIFYLVVIASSLRFGLTGSLACAAVISVVYLAVGIVVEGHFDTTLADLYASHLFLFFALALVCGLLVREMVSARARQLTHTYELETITFNELREVDRIKSEFMMLASHELRTPLTKIKAWISLMQDAGDRLPASAREEGIQELRAESEHLARLTDNLLCIAQLESGEIRIKTAMCDLDEVINQTISRFIESADRSRFLITVAPDAARVMADAERLALVLACLVDNALKFSPVGEQVHIETSRHGRKIWIEVQDNGRRIPDGDLDRVFASFYQVESPLLRQRGGFGVGLYLSRQLIERMGGNISINNTRARGNTFVVMLPTNL